MGNINCLSGIYYILSFQLFNLVLIRFVLFGLMKEDLVLLEGLVPWIPN